MNRRSFIRGAAGAGIALGAGLPAIGRALPLLGDKPNLSHVEARYYVKLPEKQGENHGLYA